VAWEYSERVHRRQTVERLAESFLAELRALISHCLGAGAGGRTPSDFPLAALTQRQLDSLLRERPEAEDIYALSPVQQGMLFHSLFAPHSGVYVNYLGWGLRGEFDERAFGRAWERLLGRHEVLRTSFAWEGLAEPVQVVERRAVLPLGREDWRGLEEAERRRRLAEFVAEERARGFDLTRAPLMRVRLIRTGEETYEVVWVHHHLLTDGWCVGQLLDELFSSYEAERAGAEPVLERRRPYRDYIGWLRGRGLGEAEGYWRRLLEGFRGPTPLPHARPAAAQPSASVAGGGAEEREGGDEAGGYGEVREWLTAEQTARLREFARRERLTLGTLVQGAWALLLSRYAGEEDVVFGATVAGRPAELEGVERMVGVFINTLPVRARVAPRAPVGAWLRGLQEQGAETRQYEHSPLARVQGWGGGLCSRASWSTRTTRPRRRWRRGRARAAAWRWGRCGPSSRRTTR
jgi:hypothetical protein